MFINIHPISSKGNEAEGTLDAKLRASQLVPELDSISSDVEAFFLNVECDQDSSHMYAETAKMRLPLS